MRLPEIIGWHHDPVRNPQDAQPWMYCHGVSLPEMHNPSKHEIAPCAKDRRGGTGQHTLHTLNDAKGVPRDGNHCRKRLVGAHGAVPQLRAFQNFATGGIGPKSGCPEVSDRPAIPFSGCGHDGDNGETTGQSRLKEFPEESSLAFA